MTKKISVMSLVIFACIALLGAPAGFAADALKVGAYGGYFKDSFDKHIYPDFTRWAPRLKSTAIRPTHL